MPALDNLAAARQYLAAIESGATGEILAGFFTPDIVQHEFQILEGAERGRQVLRTQRYEVLNAHTSGDNVALEVQWTGTLALPVGSLPAGATIRARFAVFLEYHNGRIARQRNYDCFDPW